MVLIRAGSTFLAAAEFSSHTGANETYSQNRYALPLWEETVYPLLLVHCCLERYLAVNKHHLEDIVDGFLSVVVCVVYCGRVFYLLDRKVLF